MKTIKIGVVGLGYVGLPLARLFSTKYPTVGYDRNPARVAALNTGHDTTLEVADDLLQQALRQNLTCTFVADQLADCNFYVIAVPTPVDDCKNPDLTPLLEASRVVGPYLKQDDVVVFESTVYPGVTEDACVPVLVETSGLRYNTDFFVGYSPERINPGDKEHTVECIRKITSGSTPEAATFVDNVYASVIKAGTHKASSIKVAEAAKVIENAQRDINIAFVNELSKIFSRMGINTQDVLAAAGTKWNFLPFHPGLVGGHCIGVDPYYLAQCAQKFGYHPEVILAGRRVNDGMGEFVAYETIKLMVKKNISVLQARVLVLGFTFKEDCPDIRNTKVVDILHTVLKYAHDVVVVDPWADPAAAKRQYGITLYNQVPEGLYDVVILAVAHTQFKDLDVRSFMSENAVLYDVKGFFDRNKYPVDGGL